MVQVVRECTCHCIARLEIFFLVMFEGLVMGRRMRSLMLTSNAILQLLGGRILKVQQHHTIL